MRKRLLSTLPPLCCAVYLFYPVLRLFFLPFQIQLMPPDLPITLCALTVAGCILCLLCVDPDLPETRAVRVGRLLACPACLLNAVCFACFWTREEIELPLVGIAAACGAICALIPLFTTGPLRRTGLPLKVILPLLTALFCVSLSVSAQERLNHLDALWTIEEYVSPGGSQTLTVQTQNMHSDGTANPIQVYERRKDLNIGIGLLRFQEELVYFSLEKHPKPNAIRIRWTDARTYEIMEIYDSISQYQ